MTHPKHAAHVGLVYASQEAMAAPESRVDIYDGIKKWERNV